MGSNPLAMRGEHGLKNIFVNYVLDTKEQSVRVKKWKEEYYFLFIVGKVSHFEMANEREENMYENLCVRYEGTKC